MKKRLFYFAVMVISGILLIYSCSKSHNSPNPVITGNGATASVSIVNMSFSPDTLKIAAGTTVTWTNNDSMTHTVTATGGLFDSGNLPAGMTFTHTFSTAGTYNYRCVIHANMKAVIVVTSSSGY